MFYLMNHLAQSSILFIMSVIEYLLCNRIYMSFCKHMKNVRRSQVSILINYCTALSKTSFRISLIVCWTTSFNIQQV